MISASLSYSFLSSLVLKRLVSCSCKFNERNEFCGASSLLLCCGLRKVVAQVKALWCYRYLYSYSYTM